MELQPLALVAPFNGSQRKLAHKRLLSCASKVVTVPRGRPCRKLWFAQWFVSEFQEPLQSWQSGGRLSHDPQHVQKEEQKEKHPLYIYLDVTWWFTLSRGFDCFLCGKKRTNKKWYHFLFLFRRVGRPRPRLYTSHCFSNSAKVHHLVQYVAKLWNESLRESHFPTGSAARHRHSSRSAP